MKISFSSIKVSLSILSKLFVKFKNINLLRKFSGDYIVSRKSGSGLGYWVAG